MTKLKTICFEKKGWEDYLYWQSKDKKLLTKINNLIKEVIRTPFEGSGKPEMLKGDFTGLWSRRVNHEHRLVYMVNNDEIIILQCRFHYSK